MTDTNVWKEDVARRYAESLVFSARCRNTMHQPPLTLEAWKRERVRLIKNIKQNMGSFPPAPELDIHKHGSVKPNGYRLQKITYQSREGMRVTANLYVPEGRGPFPGILNVHGHWPQGKIAARVQERAHVMAAEGFVVLSVDAFGAGERGSVPGEYEYHGGAIGSMLLDIGETLMGMQVYDNMRAIDLLQSLEYVDPERIGAMGASGGGNQTMWLSALDPRVKAAVPVVSVGTFESYVTRSNCICEALPNGLEFMEEWGALGLVAPNALLILNSLRDYPTFSVQEMIRSFNGAREIYKLYGVEDRIAYKAIDLPHGFHPEMQRATLGWLKRWLQKKGDGRSCSIPVIQVLPEKKCLCFPNTKRSKNVCSIPEFVAPVARKLAKQHLADKSRISRSWKLRTLKKILKLRDRQLPPECSATREAMENGRRTLRFVLQTEPGVFVPVLVFKGSAPKSVPASLVVHPAGKAELVESGRLDELLKSKSTVVLADLRGTGEQFLNLLVKTPQNIMHGNTDFLCNMRALLWLGRTLTGDWTFDLLTLVDFLDKKGLTRSVNLTAFNEAGPAALCASAMSSSIKQVTCANSIGSYCTKRPVVNRHHAVRIPGILEWGDISMMAALPKCAVELNAPVDIDGKPYSTSQRKRLKVEIHMLSRRLGSKKHSRIK